MTYLWDVSYTTTYKVALSLYTQLGTKREMVNACMLYALTMQRKRDILFMRLNAYFCKALAI